METEAEKFRMQHAGLVARSAQGHAAKGMKIKDQEDMWVSIQHNTFRNWINVQLRETGLRVEDLSNDMTDGVALVTLIETLQKRRLKKITKVTNQHQALENVTNALNAIAEDGIKLVNIGNVDIVNGNLKLILGLIWSLIMHYQIGQTKFPPKKLMLSWLKGALPDCKVNNFTSDWNSGINLSALIDYCKPGTFRSWKNLNPKHSVDNCKKAMEIAHKEFNIPMVLEPEYLASPYLDDLSGMTYLSYFMKDGGPGYNATLKWVQNQLPEKNIKNFTTNWNDGTNLSTLVKKLGGPVRNYRKISKDPAKWENNIQSALDAGKKIGVEPVLSAQDFARPDVEYLGPMAYISYFQWIRPRTCPTDNVKVKCDINNVRVNNPVPFNIEFLSKEVNPNDVKAQVIGPTGPVKVDLELGPRGGKGSFLAKTVGFYELQVTNEDEPVEGSPINIRALPDVSKIMFSGLDPCALGSIVEVVINSNGAGGGEIDVTAISPTKRPLRCPVKEEDGVYAATFQPDEAGEWAIGVSYDEEHIQGSPFQCHVYDPNALKVRNLDDGPGSITGRPFTILLDATECGWGEAKADVTLNGKSYPSKTFEVSPGYFETTFTPVEVGKYKIYVYFNGHEVRGSPFPLYLGIEKPPERKYLKTKKKKSSKSKEVEVEPIIKEYSSKIDSPAHRGKGGSDNILNKIYDSTSSKTFRSSYSGNDEVDNKTKTYFSSETNTNTSSFNKNEDFSDKTKRFLGKNYTSSLDRPYSNSTKTNDRMFNSLNRTNYDTSYSNASTTKVHERSLSPERQSPRRISFEKEDSPKRSLFSKESSPSYRLNKSFDKEDSPRRSIFNKEESSSYNINKSFELSPSRTEKITGNVKVTGSLGSTKSNSSPVKYNSTYDKSTHNSILNSSTTTYFEKEPSPYRYSPPPEKYSKSKSSVITNYTEKPIFESPRASPYRQMSSVQITDHKGLSAPSKVLEISQNAAKTSEEFENYHSLREEVDDHGRYSSTKISRSCHSRENLYDASPPNSPSVNRTPISTSSSSSSTKREKYSKTESTSYYSNKNESKYTPVQNTNSIRKEYHVPIRFESSEDSPGRYESSNKYTSSKNSQSENNAQYESSNRFESSNKYRSSKNPQSGNNVQYESSNRYELYNRNGNSSRNGHQNELSNRSEANNMNQSFTRNGSKNFEMSNRYETTNRYEVNDRITSSDRNNTSDKIDTTYEKSNRNNSSNKYDSIDRHESSNRFEKFNRYDSIDRNESSNRFEKSNRYDSIDRNEPSNRIENSNRYDSIDRKESSNRFEKSNRNDSIDRTESSNRFEKSNRYEAPIPKYKIKLNPSLVTAHGPGVNLAPVRKSIEFAVVSEEILHEEFLSIEIVGPERRTIPYSISTEDGRVIVEYVPKIVGEYFINIEVQDEQIPNSPFRCFVYDAKKIQVGDIPDGIRGLPVEFQIDGSEAGSGNLEILVNGGHVTSSVRKLGQHLFLASFVPYSVQTHTIEMKFNGEEVPGSPWSIAVMDGPGPRVHVMGESIRHFPAGKLSSFDISAAGVSSKDIQIHIISPSKRPVSYQIGETDLNDSEGLYTVSFITSEVGSYVVEVNAGGQKVRGSPFIAKAYDSGLIRVSDVPNGVVGQPCQFRVDASQAGEGQLEISINDGEVPNHVQVLGGGRCLVSFTPDVAKIHTIDIKFNGETVRGCPFICKVSDTSRVSLTLRHLELIPIGQPATFNISVDGGGSAELTVTVRTPSHSTLPVRVSGNVRQGFSAEFTPEEVGAHTIIVNFNESTVSGTPFTCKVYDATKVGVSHLPRGAIGKSLQFIVDASEAGEGNLEISISAADRNIPTQVHPQGSARFAVSFIPLEAIDHIISISFNKIVVPGSPFIAKVQADPNRIAVSGQALAATAVGKTSFFTISNVAGSVEDVEVSVEGPPGLSIPAQVIDAKDGTFRVEFTPKNSGEHRIHVSYMGESIPGSPFSCKVYDVNAIKVRPAEKGMVGKPVTFLVETNNAGPGNLEVTVNGGQVPTGAQAQGNHIYAISFTPKESKPHVVELSFNGEPVPRSPFVCQVVDVSRVTVVGPGLEKIPVNVNTFILMETQASIDQVSVNILSASRIPVESQVNETGDGKIKIDYTPREVGDHGIEIRVGGVLVPGSPFLVKAYDPNKVQVTDITSGIVSKPVYFSIDASQAGAGNLEIIVSVNGRNVPNYVQSEGHAKFKVNFKPKEAAVHTLSVKFNGDPVPGSPFQCRVTDTNNVVIGGVGIKMASLDTLASFSVDPRGSEANECRVQITSPTGEIVPVKISGQMPDKVTAEYKPHEVGPHSISVMIDGEPVTGSPFTCNVYDVTKVRVTGLEGTKVNHPITFTVDASQAGEGTLELVVSTAKASVRAEVAARSRGLYDVTFTPHETIPHFVNITFNEKEVIGSPFKCEVKDLEPRDIKNIKRKESQMASAAGPGLKQIVTGSLSSFIVDTKGLEGDLDIRVTGPDGGQVPARLFKMRGGMHRAEYQVSKIGIYSISIIHQGKLVPGAPFKVEAVDPTKVVVRPSSQCFVNQEGNIRIDTSKAGRGSLSLVMRAAGTDVKHTIRDVGNGIHQVLFYPKIPIPHKVDVKYNSLPVKDSPFEINVKNPSSGQSITASGVGLYHAKVGKATSFVIETMGRPSKDFDVLITGPKDSCVQMKCYQQRDGNLLAEYTPHAPGSYHIEVSYSGKHVKGSPFKCSAYDPSKIHIDQNKANASVGDVCKFRIDKSTAGEANLDSQIRWPNGKIQYIEPKSNAHGDYIEWQPESPGQYKIEVSYGGEDIPGSPITVDVGEAGLATVVGSGLITAKVDQSASFSIDGRGIQGEPTVTAEGPDSVARVAMRQQEEGLYQVTYTPHEVGIFDVRVLWNKKDVLGSPFHPKVVDLNKVRLIGGWDSLKDENGRFNFNMREEKKISFDISEAGPGKLEAEISQGAKQILSQVEQNGNRAKVSFIPPCEGSYELKFTYNGMNLPQSPIVGMIPASSSNDHTRVTLKGHGLTTARCGAESEFTIDGSGAGPGSPDVTISGTKADITIQLINEGNGVWTAKYVPVIPGAYLLNVMWSDRQVRGCPLKINVDSTADSSKVVCSGDGLRHGMVGQEIKSFIDTRKAGPGELTARCVGPHKVAVCELYDHRDGTFTLNIKPQESGRHQLSVMYEGEHVPGSPYSLKIAGAPDASKVRVYGPGIEHGVLASYQSRFICDTRGAGAGQLTVKIRGPKGAFRVEMQRESQKDRTILCKFDPTEPGDYRIEVKWSGENVPGSPFIVMIFDTQDELNRYMSGRYSPNGHNGHSTDPYGSIGYGYGAVNFGQMSWRGSQAQL